MTEDSQNNYSCYFNLLGSSLGLVGNIFGGEAKLDGAEADSKIKKIQAAGKAASDAAAINDKKQENELKDTAKVLDAGMKREGNMVDLFETGLSTIRSWYDAKCEDLDDEITVGEYPAGDPYADHYG